MTAFDAYEPPPPNELVRPIAFLSLMVVGAWNVCGWLMSDTPLALRVFLAAFTITFEILCFPKISRRRTRDEQSRSPILVLGADHVLWMVDVQRPQCADAVHAGNERPAAGARLYCACSGGGHRSTIAVGD